MESEIEGGMKNLKNSTARQIKYLDVNPQKWFENGHNDTKQYLPHFGDLQQIFCIFCSTSPQDSSFVSHQAAWSLIIQNVTKKT